jgi:hypothetical protein
MENSFVANDHFSEPAATTSAANINQGPEQFSANDLQGLRSDLLQTNVDSFQAAELVVSFLSGRGYGISSDEARGLASRMEAPGFSVESMQAEMERVARSA